MVARASGISEIGILENGQFICGSKTIGRDYKGKVMNPTRKSFYKFVRQHRRCVVSTISENGAPEAALVYFAVTVELELIFYAIQTTRKVENLRRNPRIAAVIGLDAEQTLQYEGIADEPKDTDLDEVKKVFLEMLPDRSGRLGYPGLTFIRVRPSWIRFSNYDEPWKIDKITFPCHDAARNDFRSFWWRLSAFLRLR